MKVDIIVITMKYYVWTAMIYVSHAKVHVRYNSGDADRLGRVMVAVVHPWQLPPLSAEQATLPVILAQTP